MQRLACVSFVRRLASGAVMSAAASQTSARYGSDYVNKVAKKKVEQGDDERWLEAEIDENINTPEERYAHAREIEALKKLVSQLKDKHAEDLQEAVQERNKELSDLKKQMSELQEKMSKLGGK